MSDEEEMVPPWEAFPTYTRYTIGWRMGNGEQYRYDWYDFIKEISSFDDRLAYLKRHQPAPLNWGISVYSTLYPDVKFDYEINMENLDELLKLEVVEYDAAYKTWLHGQNKIEWPWMFAVYDEPEKFARYMTREFWFFSRQLRTQRESGHVKIEKISEKWKNVAQEIQTGKVLNINPEKGLLMLSKMLCTGSVIPPWVLGLSLDDFDDNFEMDMGYVDAFRLWIMCCFDDNVLLSKILQNTSITNEWQNWVTEQCDFEF